MANKIKEIKKFLGGIFSSFSSSDIGDDAASFSENIDSSMKDGVLKGIPKHKKITNRLIKTDISVIVDNEDGTRDLIFNDYDSGKPGIIKDFYGQFTSLGIMGGSDTGYVPVDMVSSNDKVFLGSGQNVPSKILYRTKKVAFEDGEGNNEWRYDKSACEGPSSSFSLDRMLYLDGSHRYGFGIRYDHNDIYFVDMQEGTTEPAADDGIYRTIPDLQTSNPTIDLGSSQKGSGYLAGAACDFCRADINYDYTRTNASQGTWNHPDNYEDAVTWHNYWFLLQGTGASSNTGAETILLQKCKLWMSDGDTGTPSDSTTYVCDFDDAPPSGAAPGSILETRNYLWITLWKPSGNKFGRNEPFIYSAKLSDISAGSSIQFKNRSLEWDNIKHKHVDFNLGWFSDKLTEHYFYNSDESWSTLDNNDWLRGWSDDYTDEHSTKGGHKYSGIFWTTGTKGFSIYRHCLIPSPDWVSGDYDNGNCPGGAPMSGEDFVGILSRAEGALVNIHSALEYKVPKNIGSDYWKLRPSSGDVEGANGWFGEIGKGLWNLVSNVIETVAMFGAAFLALLQVKGAGTWISALYHKSVNMYYNGLAFETGIIYDCIIQTSSSHDPSAKLNPDDGSRIKIRTLEMVNQGNKRLDFLDIKYFDDRIIISAVDNQDDDGDLETTFLFYDVHKQSMANLEPSLIITDKEKMMEDYQEYAAFWEEQTGHGTGDGIGSPSAFNDELPNLYYDLHGSKNVVLQPYLPLLNPDMMIKDPSSSYILFDGEQMLESLEPTNGYYFDFSTTSFWRFSDEIDTENPRSVFINEETGARFPVGSAVFAINTAWRNPWDGAKTFHYTRYPNSKTSEITGTSSEMYKYRSSQITLISTSGPLNISKHPFKWSITDSTSGSYVNFAGQLGIPSGNADADGTIPLTQVTPYYTGTYPMTINFAPGHLATDNQKQFALGVKEISMRVKGTDYTGDNVPDFHYSVADGKELYRYKINYVYDSYQDSPLSRYFTEVNFFTDFAALGLTNNGDSGSETDIDVQAAALTVTINLHKPENVNKRITHIRLWRSQVTKSNSGGEEHFQIPASYTLVDTIELDGRWGLTDESVTIYGDSSVQLGKIATFTVIDNGNIGPSYEAYTGMPESIRLSSIDYRLSEELNGFMYIANCSHPSFENASRLIFRSQSHRYSMFDWTRDFVALPNLPTALSSFDGRIIAFDDNNMYVINPDGLYIEDTFEGSGCIGQHALARSERGLCFADNQSIFLYDGKEVKQIGTPIVRAHNYGKKISWNLKSNDYPVYIKFEPERRSYCVFFAVEPQYGNNWYERGEQLSPSSEFKRWYDYYNVDNSENRRYLFNHNMVSNYSSGTNLPTESYESEGMVIPYGCGWDSQEQRYIADTFSILESINPGIGNGDLFGADSETSYITKLKQGDYPDYNEVFDDNQKWKPEDEWGYYCYMYNVDRNRWDLAKIPQYRGVFAGSEGELYGSILGGEDWVADFEEGSIAHTYAISESTIYGGASNTAQYWHEHGYVESQEEYNENQFTMIKANIADVGQYNTPLVVGYSMRDDNIFSQESTYGMQDVKYQFTEARAQELNAKIYELAERISYYKTNNSHPHIDSLVWGYQDDSMFPNNDAIPNAPFPNNPDNDNSYQLTDEHLAEWGSLGQNPNVGLWMYNPVDHTVKYTYEQVRDFFRLLNTMPSGEFWPDIVEVFNPGSGEGEPDQWSPGEPDPGGQGGTEYEYEDPNSYQGLRPTVSDAWVAANWTPDFELPSDPLNYYHELHPGYVQEYGNPNTYDCYSHRNRNSFLASIGYYPAFTEHPESIFSIRQELNNGTLTETYVDVWNDYMNTGYEAWKDLILAGYNNSPNFENTYLPLEDWGAHINNLMNITESITGEKAFIREPYSGNNWSHDAISPQLHYYSNQLFDTGSLNDGLAAYSTSPYGTHANSNRLESYRTDGINYSPSYNWNFTEFSQNWDDYNKVSTVVNKFYEVGQMSQKVIESYEPIYILDNESHNSAHKLEIYKTFQKSEYAELLLKWATYDEDNNGIGWDADRIGSILSEGTPISWDPSIIPDSSFTLKRLWGSEHLKRFQWISKNFDLENQTVNKILSRIKIIYKGTPPIFRYMTNDDGQWKIPLISHLDIEGYCINFKVPVEHKKAKSIKIKILSDIPLLGNSYDTEVDSFSIIYRTRGNV